MGTKQNNLRDAIAKTVKLMAKNSIQVTQRGASAYCAFDGKGRVIKINLPVIPDNPTPQFMIALQGFLDHEVSHALHTDGTVGNPGNSSSTTEVDAGPERTATQSRNLHQMTNIVEDICIYDGEPAAYAEAVKAAEMITAIGLTASVATLPANSDPGDADVSVILDAIRNAKRYDRISGMRMKMNNPYHAT
jgi:hypothetical protein